MLAVAVTSRLLRTGVAESVTALPRIAALADFLWCNGDEPTRSVVTQ